MALVTDTIYFIVLLQMHLHNSFLNCPLVYNNVCIFICIEYNILYLNVTTIGFVEYSININLISVINLIT